MRHLIRSWVCSTSVPWRSPVSDDRDSVSTAAPCSLPGPVRTDRGAEGRRGLSLQHSVPLQLSYTPHTKFRSAALTLQSTSWGGWVWCEIIFSQTWLMGTILCRMLFTREYRCTMMTDCGGWEQISTDTATWAWKQWLHIIQRAHLQRWSDMHFLYKMIVIPVLSDMSQRS